MNTATTEVAQPDPVMAGIIDYLAGDPLCLEIRHYPAANELAGSEKLHLLVIMERELKQAERAGHIKAINRIAGEDGPGVDVIFSSPKVWRDLTALVGPFTRIEKESVVDWRRN